MGKQKDEYKDTLQYFTHAPIHVIIFRTFRKMMSIGNDIIQENDIYKMIDIVLHKDNVIYVGITLVIFSILLMFISL